MTKKELLEKIKDMPDDAVIEVFDNCCSTCCGNEASDAWYKESENTITIA